MASNRKRTYLEGTDFKIFQKEGVSFTCIFSDSQAAIKSLSSVLNNTRIVKYYHSYLNHVSGRFSVTFIWAPGHCRADELQLRNPYQ